MKIHKETANKVLFDVFSEILVPEIDAEERLRRYDALKARYNKKTYQ